MKTRILTTLFIACSAIGLGQNVGIGTTSFTPNASSVLELRSTNSGFLMPRMTQAQMNAIISPAEGLLVYQNNGTKGFKYFDGSVWTDFGAGGADNFGSHIAESNIQLDDFWLSNDGGNEGIRITNTGNVGIGIADPAERLHVNGRVSINEDIYDAAGNIRLSGEDDVFITMDYNNNDGETRSIRFGKNSMTSPTELMRISENGNVGIGTSTPDRLLNIGSASGPQMLFTREDNTTMAGDVLGEIIFDSTDDTAPSSNDGSAVIRATASENQGNSNKGGNLIFLTKNTGTWGTNPATERMTITHNGNVGVGATNPVAKLHVSGDARITDLAGSGTRMVVANANGDLSTQPLPSSGSSPTTVESSSGQNINSASYSSVSGMSISSVSAGTYLVNFNADISRNGSSSCQCIVRAGGSDDSDTERSFEIPSSGASQFHLMGKVTLSSTGTIEIRCKKIPGGSGITIENRAMCIQATN